MIKAPPSPKVARCDVYIVPPKKKFMTIIKLRPDAEDLVQAHIKRSKDFLLISIGEVGVEVGSTLTSEQELFYLELAKSLIIKDWLADD